MRTRTCRLALNPPFSKSSVLAPNVSMRYRPIAGSPVFSPERTDRTYVRTRSSMSDTDRRARSMISRSDTGWEDVDVDEAEVFMRRSTEKIMMSTGFARQIEMEGRTSTSLSIVETQIHGDRSKDTIFGFWIYTHGRTGCSGMSARSSGD